MPTFCPRLCLADVPQIIAERSAPERTCPQGSGEIERTILELLGDVFVNGITEVLHCALASPQHHRRAVVRSLSSRLRVDSDQVELLPHHFHELVDIEPELGRDGHRVRDLPISRRVSPQKRPRCHTLYRRSSSSIEIASILLRTLIQGM